MAKYDILDYLRMANEAINEDDVKNFDEFMDWMSKTISGFENTDRIPDFKLVSRAWIEAWENHVESIKESIRLRAKSIMAHFYRDYVVRNKIITEEEFDEVLKENELMRIPKEQ